MTSSTPTPIYQVHFTRDVNRRNQRRNLSVNVVAPDREAAAAEFYRSANPDQHPQITAIVQVHFVYRDGRCLTVTVPEAVTA